MVQFCSGLDNLLEDNVFVQVFILSLENWPIANVALFTYG